MNINIDSIFDRYSLHKYSMRSDKYLDSLIVLMNVSLILNRVLSELFLLSIICWRFNGAVMLGAGSRHVCMYFVQPVRMTQQSAV